MLQQRHNTTSTMPITSRASSTASVNRSLLPTTLGSSTDDNSGDLSPRPKVHRRSFNTMLRQHKLSVITLLCIIVISLIAAFSFIGTAAHKNVHLYMCGRNYSDSTLCRLTAQQYWLELRQKLTLSNSDGIDTVSICDATVLNETISILHDTMQYNTEVTTVGKVQLQKHTTLKSQSKYNKQYPIQRMHNVCMRYSNSQPEIIVLTGDAKHTTIQRIDDITNKVQRDSLYPNLHLQRGFSAMGYKYYWRNPAYNWLYTEKAKTTWRYVKGTTLIDTVQHDGTEYGELVTDHITPMLHTLLNSNLQCIGLDLHKQPIDNILLNSGCVDTQQSSTASTTGIVGLSDTSDWLLRLSLMNDPYQYDSSIPYIANSELAYMQLDTLQNDNQCTAETEPVCFETLLINGANEDRLNTICTVEQQHTPLYHIRNNTFNMLNIPVPYHITAIQQNTDSTDVDSETATTRYGLPRVLYYDRSDMKTRRVANTEAVRTKLQKLKAFNQIDLKMVYNIESLPFCELVSLFSNVDIVIMPHSSAIFAMMYAPENSMLIELWPTLNQEHVTDDLYYWSDVLHQNLNIEVIKLQGKPTSRIPHANQHDTKSLDLNSNFTIDAENIVNALKSAGVYMVNRPPQ